MADPELFGRYRVVKRIGSGAFASVWLAHDDVLDGSVAVKVLADNWAGRVDVRERFVDEARMLRRADSDRVVRVHDIGDLPDGRPYFVMTYADSGTLADRLTGVPMGPGEALWFAAETARGVAVLHGRGIIHRDVKPSNVLLRSGHDGPEVLVSDLGLAKAALAASGMTLAAGTPGYMPPEQAEGFGLTFASDVYALAALTYRLLTGETPRRGESPRSILGRAGDPVRPVALMRSDVPVGLDAVLARGLARDPGDRYPDARAFERALVTVAGDVPVRPGVTVAGGSAARIAAGRAGASGGAGSSGAAGRRPAAAGSERYTGLDADGRPVPDEGALTPGGAPTVLVRAGAVRAAAGTGPDTGGGPGAGAGAGEATQVLGRAVPVAAPQPVPAPARVGPTLRPVALIAPVPAPSPPLLTDEALVGPAVRRGARRGTRLRRVVGVGALALGVLAAGGALAGAVEPGLRSSALAAMHGDRFVENGPLSVNVPARWAGRFSTGSVAVAGLPAPQQTLTVSVDPASVRDLADSRPGAVVSLWSGDVTAALDQRAARSGCDAAAPVRKPVAGFTGSLTRWTCGRDPGPGRWDDFVGTDPSGRTLLVQVKGAANAGQADDVLDSVRVAR